MATTCATGDANSGKFLVGGLMHRVGQVHGLGVTTRIQEFHDRGSH